MLKGIVLERSAKLKGMKQAGGKCRWNTKQAGSDQVPASHLVAMKSLVNGRNCIYEEKWAEFDFDVGYFFYDGGIKWLCQ